MQKNDIHHLDDVKLLVDTFYGKVREDTLLSPVFNERIQDRWPQHIQKMYTFWQTLLLNERTYYGRPFIPHTTLPVATQHFDRWMKLFSETVDEFFQGEIAEEAKWRASKMAEMFQLKIGAIQDTKIRGGA